MGLIIGLRAALTHNPSALFIGGDSKLVINQMTGKFKVRSASLRRYYNEASDLLEDLKCDVVFKHVLRAENALADSLVNVALDNPGHYGLDAREDIR